MALSKEMVLTLTCLKEVGVKGVGPKKIFSIGAIIMDKGLNVEHLEELLKNAIIARTMLNSIASETDENYSAYKKQSETAYRLLVKYAKGVGVEKGIKI